MVEKKNVVTEPQLNVSAGMFDLGDGSFARKVSGNQKFRSVIVDVDERRGIALGICPTLIMLPWSYSALEIDTADIVSGREATAILLEEAKKQGVELVAAEYCHNYTGVGVEKGMAFLPTRFELSRVSSLEKAFAMIGLNKCDGTCWSSSVGYNGQVWMQSTTKYSVSSWQLQMRTFGVMPMIEIKL